MKIAAVIPNWNGGDLLRRAITSLLRQSQRPSRILVVDNGSSDGSAEVAESLGATVLRLHANLGFARAVNAGVQHCLDHEVIAIINNDVELEHDWLLAITRPLAECDVWFACGKLLNGDQGDILDGSYDVLCRGGTAWRCGEGRQDSAIYNRPASNVFAPMTAAVFKTDLFRGAGLLDEVFESYLEDVEFGLRCGSKGYTGCYVPEAVARHRGSATLGRWHPRTVRQIARNQLLILARHYPTGLLRAFGWPIAVSQFVWGLVALRHGAGLAWLLGKVEGFRTFRQNRGAGCNDIGALLTSSEDELYRLQRETGFDLYWRIYFTLTGR
jgi:GT2 family glycosyltransferase